jgi:hypothetical protein
MTPSKIPLYLISVLLFMFVLPLTFILVQYSGYGLPLGWALIGKWFVFWSVGVRLFIAGIRQVSKPAFTATQIFHITDKASFVIVRELGFANLSIGFIGMLSLFKAEWCVLAAIAGGLFFGLAGIGHLFKKPDSHNEVIALISDLFICVVMVLYLIFT